MLLWSRQRALLSRCVVQPRFADRLTADHSAQGDVQDATIGLGFEVFGSSIFHKEEGILVIQSVHVEAS